MSEITLTYKIVIVIALLLTFWGIILYRRQSRELANKSDELKHQKFMNKQAAIAEEIAMKLKLPKEINPPHNSLKKETKIPGPTLKTLSGSKETINATNVQISAPEPDAINLSLEKQAKQKITSQTNQIHSKRASSTTENRFYTNQNDSLHKQIAAYAKWIATQSTEFMLEQYENGVQVGHVQLLFDEGHLERLNGHWFDLFRPQDMSLIIKAMKKDNGGLFCPFSSEALERIQSPAIEFLEKAKAEPTEQNQRLIKECALQEFCDYLDELQSLTTNNEQKSLNYN